jgi:hypothetical protein
MLAIRSILKNPKKAMRKRPPTSKRQEWHTGDDGKGARSGGVKAPLAAGIGLDPYA